jgi:hypothetical protein
MFVAINAEEKQEKTGFHNHEFNKILDIMQEHKLQLDATLNSLQELRVFL